MTQRSEISRRTLLRGAALGSLALATERVFGQQPTKPPNIVFILADDLGYADVGCYGRPDLATPNIDRLATNGVRFLQAYANSAVCTATRTALITGRYQYRVRVGLEEPLNTSTATVGLPRPRNAPVPAATGRLYHVPRWKVAPRDPAEFWSVQERLRPLSDTVEGQSITIHITAPIRRTTSGMTMSRSVRSDT